MSELFRITFQINRRVVFVPSKSISATNRAFGTVFVKSFYFIRLQSKLMVTFADLYNYLSHNHKGNEKSNGNKK